MISLRWPVDDLLNVLCFLLIIVSLSAFKGQVSPNILGMLRLLIRNLTNLHQDIKRSTAHHISFNPNNTKTIIQTTSSLTKGPRRCIPLPPLTLSQCHDRLSSPTTRLISIKINGLESTSASWRMHARDHCPSICGVSRSTSQTFHRLAWKRKFVFEIDASKSLASLQKFPASRRSFRRNLD